MTDAIDAFRDAIAAAGLTPPETIEPDGTLHRYPTNGARGDDSGWYTLHPNDIAAGAFGDWRSGVSETWCSRSRSDMSETEREQYRRTIAETRRQRDAERERVHAKARERAAEIWERATPETGQHRYLRDRGVQAYGIRTDGERLIVPMRDTDGVLHSVQYIDPRGDKLFLKCGRASGGYHAVGKRNGVLCITEGYATGASIHEATGHAVAVAFSAGNLEPVARALRAKYPDLRMIVCADDDTATDGNPGLTKAAAAARTVGGLLAVPDFGAERPTDATDFNDLARLRGLDAVSACIANAKPTNISNVSGISVSNWPQPQSLTVATASAPYPIEALPGGIGAAVREVVTFVQCPASLSACSALSAVSLTCQGLADVRRADKLSGPCSLYLLAIAESGESGERKTSCDGYFTSAIREWEREQTAHMEPEVSHHTAALNAWTAKRDGVLQAIKQASRSGKSTSLKEDELDRLEADKPQAPRVPSLTYGDTTPEALAFNLAQFWPSGGVLSSEAGIVFGGHAMGRESITRNLALLNSLWDGRGHKVHRRTTDSFNVEGVRLTMGLSVQPDVVRAFFENSKGLTRGSSFAARFLIAWPQSTQGSRLFRPAPESWPHLSAFHRRITTLLDQTPTINPRGELELSQLSLSQEAEAAWINFHDEVEHELKPRRRHGRDARRSEQGRR